MFCQLFLPTASVDRLIKSLVSMILLVSLIKYFLCIIYLFQVILMSLLKKIFNINQFFLKKKFQKLMLI